MVSLASCCLFQDHLAAAEEYYAMRHGKAWAGERRYLDIGANLGYFSMLAASKGLADYDQVTAQC